MCVGRADWVRQEKAHGFGVSHLLMCSGSVFVAPYHPVDSIWLARVHTFV